MRLGVISHPCFRRVNRRVHVELARRGVEILILAPGNLRGLAADAPGADDPPLKFVSLTSDNPRTYLFEGAHDLLAAFRPDAILVESDPVSRLVVDTGRWARRHGAKCLCLSVDNLDFGVVPHLLRTGVRTLPQVLAKAALHSAAVRLVDAVFTISKDGADVFRKRGYRRVVQAPLGFDPALFHLDGSSRAAMRSRLGVPDDTVLFGYFGRVSPQKGMHLIVDALAQVARQHPEHPNWRLLMDRFEEDEYAREIQAQIESLGLTSRMLRFESSHDEIADYMRATDVVLLASLSTKTSVEQYGRVIPEAMACGALAIVSDSGTPKDLVGKCGIVLPEGKLDRLVDAIAGVLARPAAYDGMRAAGAKRAHDLLSISRQADIFLQTINEVAANCAS